MTITLDEVFERLRSGTHPRELAEELGVSQKTLRNRSVQAGRLEEYKASVAAGRAHQAWLVDIDRLMACADRGMSFNSACVECGYCRTTASMRLEDEGRMGEYYLRQQEARKGHVIPKVSAQEYRQGARLTLVSLMPKLSEEDADALRAAIEFIDRAMSDGDALSRLCGGIS